MLEGKINIVHVEIPVISEDRKEKILRAIEEVVENAPGRVEIRPHDEYWELNVTIEHERPTQEEILEMMNRIDDFGNGSVLPGIVDREGETKCYLETRKERI